MIRGGHGIGALAGGVMSVVMVGAVAAVVVAGVARDLLNADGDSWAAAWGAGEMMSGLARSGWVAASIALISTALALPAAWAARCWPAAVWTLAAGSLVMPSYLVHASWSRMRAPGTILGDMLEPGSAFSWEMVNLLQAVVGLGIHGWALAALLLIPAARSVGSSVLEQLWLEGAGPIRRCVTVLGLLRAGLMRAFLLVVVVMFGSAVPLHLAGVETLSLMIWRSIHEGSGAGSIWLASAPMVLAALVGARLVAGELRPAVVDAGAERVREGGVVSRWWLVGCVVVFCLSTVAPLALLASAIPGVGAFRSFWSAAVDPVRESAVCAAIVGAACVMISLSAAICSSPGAPRGAFSAARASVLAWLMMALMPGVLIGGAVFSASNWPGAEGLCDTRAGLMVAQLARFGAVAAVIGAWVGARETAELAGSRRVFAGESLRGWWRTAGASALPASLGAGLGCALLSLHEIEASVLVAPPGDPTLSRSLLALLHYLRDDQLAAAVVVLCGGTFALGVVGALLSWVFRRRSMPGGVGVAASLLLLCMILPACGRGQDDGGEKTAESLGGAGRGEGQFVVPRAIDATDDSLWIIDKTARVQRLSLQGEFEGGFRMPSFSKGMPTGVTCGPGELVYVADTHEHRVAVYDGSRDLHANAMTPREPDFAWGSYGTGPGEFIYPTDIAVLVDPSTARARRFYVSEYGGNDRVSVFDAEHRFLFTFGAPGSAGDERRPDEIVFARPQSVSVDVERGEVFVADAANHRVGRFSLEGKVLCWFGRSGALAGSEAGEFSFPYGLASGGPGLLFVVEYGNARVQLIEAQSGRSVRMWSVRSARERPMISPWGVARAGSSLFALDTGNHRVLRLEIAGGLLRP